MIDEKIVYGQMGEVAADKAGKVVMYWGYRLYQDLAALKNTLHKAKKACKGQLGTFEEFSVQELLNEAKRLGEIDWQKMPDMDAHAKVKWMQDPS